jgi:hypothetical protein
LRARPEEQEVAVVANRSGHGEEFDIEMVTGQSKSV